MKLCLNDNEEVVEFVRGTLESLKFGSALTMTITAEPYGAFYVTSATGESLEDTELQVAKFFSETQVST